MKSYVVGIDLTTMRKKPSTLAIISEDRELIIRDIYSIKEIIEFLAHLRPLIVSIDSPFQKPVNGGFRDCDLTMKKMGMKPLPPGWRGMRELVDVATTLIESIPSRVIECFPTGALNLKYKRISSRVLIQSMLDLIIEEDLKLRSKCFFKKDMLDALICAVVAKRVYSGEIDKVIVVKGEECEVYTLKL